MTLNRVLFVLACVTSSAANAQNNTSIAARNTLDRLPTMSPASGIIPGIPMGRPVQRGSTFLNNNYRPTTFRLTSGGVSGHYLAKYDIFLNEFYVITPKGLHLVLGADVQSFTWQLDTMTIATESFIAARDFKFENGENAVGFMRVLSDGPYPVVEKTEIVFKDANYNIALDVGRRDDEIVRRDKVFYIDGDVLRPLPLGRKLTPVFGEFAGKMQRFIEMNELDISQQDHALEVFHYFNERYKN